MTYFGFLLRFLIIPILIFLFITYWDHKKHRQIHGFRDGGAVWFAIGVHILLAVLYTTPWDNYLVATQVWYYNPKLVTGLLIGYVPIEEYTFFIVETLLAGLWWWFLARRIFPLPHGRGVRGEGWRTKQITCLPVHSCTLLFPGFSPPGFSFSALQSGPISPSLSSGPCRQ